MLRGLISRVIRNIIFDWSGTLVDDLPAVLKASNFVLTQAGKAEMSLEQFRAEFSLPFTKFYDRHTPHVPMPQLEDWFHAEFKHAQASVVELPHARDFLEFCREKKFRTFLVEHRPRRPFQGAMPRHRLRRFSRQALHGCLGQTEKNPRNPR